MDKSITTAAKQLGMDKSNLFKLIKKLNLQTIEKRDPEATNQMAKFLSEQDFVILQEYRDGSYKEEVEYDHEEQREQLFYVMCLAPDLSENRLKLGWSSNINYRMDTYRTSCPTVKLLKTWNCKLVWEKAIIAQAITADCTQIGHHNSEVYDCPDVERLLQRLDRIFLMFSE